MTTEDWVGGAVPDVIPLDRLSPAQAGAVAGGKGANLAELAGAGFPVPPGFVVSGPAFLRSMEHAGVRGALATDAAAAVATSGPDLATASEALRARVLSAGLSPAVRAAVAASWRDLGSVPVAVRSSAIGEDGAVDSFAGMNESFTGVVDEDAVCGAVVDCWASLYAPRALSYRAERGIAGEPVIAVVVQQMVASARSGVLFTADVVAGDRGVVVVEAVLGLGELLVKGEVEPDRYVVGKRDGRIRQVHVGEQGQALLPTDDGGQRRVALPTAVARHRVLPDDDVRSLARLGVAVERHYGVPQDCEWAQDDAGRLWLVQARPVTTGLGGPVDDRPARRRRLTRARRRLAAERG